EARGATGASCFLRKEGKSRPIAGQPTPVAVAGPLAAGRAARVGAWRMDARLEAVETPLAALRKALGPDRVLFAPGMRNSRDRDRSGFAAAVDAARRADVVLLFLGEEAILSGEARSRAFLDLPGAQDALLDAVRAAGKPIQLVIQAAR